MAHQKLAYLSEMASILADAEREITISPDAMGGLSKIVSEINDELSCCKFYNKEGGECYDKAQGDEKVCEGGVDCDGVVKREWLPA